MGTHEVRIAAHQNVERTSCEDRDLEDLGETCEVKMTMPDASIGVQVYLDRGSGRKQLRKGRLQGFLVFGVRPGDFTI